RGGCVTWPLVEIQVLDGAGSVAESHPGGELMVEVVLAAAHAADIQRRIGSHRRRARFEVVTDDHRHRRHDIKTVPGAPRAFPTGAVPFQRLTGMLRGEEHAEPTIVDLPGQLQILRADRREIDRYVLANRMDRES